MPAIFLIVGDISGNVVNAVVNAASPVVDDGIIDEVAGSIDDLECESVEQGFGKPVTASTAETFDNFSSFTIIRESRYEVQYRLPKFLALRRHFVGRHIRDQSFHSNGIVLNSQVHCQNKSIPFYM